LNPSKESRKIAEIFNPTDSSQPAYKLNQGYLNERLQLVRELQCRLAPATAGLPAGAPSSVPVSAPAPVSVPVPLSASVPASVLATNPNPTPTLTSTETNTETLSEAIADSVAFLQSVQAFEALALDPYWPKWQGPWWHALLLFELGLSKQIPRQFLQRYVELVDNHYLHFFPFHEHEVPAHLDPVSNIACHCFLGTYVQVLHSTDIALETKTDRPLPSPWIAEWFQRYQNPDGGLNCDESAYLKDPPISSITSTVAVVEAFLAKSTKDSGLDQAGRDFVDRAMDYILKRRLFRSLKNGAVINEGWLAPAFPRFYEYDVMRGLQLTTNYALKMTRKIKACDILEAFGLVDACLKPAGFIQGSSHCHGALTRVPSGRGQPLLTKQSAVCPPLLMLCDRPGSPSPWLLGHYAQILENLVEMSEAGLIIVPA